MILFIHFYYWIQHNIHYNIKCLQYNIKYLRCLVSTTFWHTVIIQCDTIIYHNWISVNYYNYSVNPCTHCVFPLFIPCKPVNPTELLRRPQKRRLWRILDTVLRMLRGVFCLVVVLWLFCLEFNSLSDVARVFWMSVIWCIHVLLLLSYYT